LGDNAVPDFGNLLRDLLRQWEDAGNALGGEAMKTAEFSQAINQAIGFSVSAKEFVSEMTGKHLAALNLPTRADVTALAEKLQAIENQIAEIKLALARDQRGEATTGAVVRPTRNRQPTARQDPSTRPFDGQA